MKELSLSTRHSSQLHVSCKDMGPKRLETCSRDVFKKLETCSRGSNMRFERFENHWLRANGFKTRAVKDRGHGAGRETSVGQGHPHGKMTKSHG